MSVKQPVDNLILSNSIRAAVSGLVKSLSNEYAQDNVLVTNACPGYTQTARLDQLAEKIARAEDITPDQIRERLASQIPLRRLGLPDEFANLVVFLASERASYITGASIAVDGGFVKGIY
jgi:3-oxoacyl-[acyl-carrier protein] reductase